MWGVPRIRTLSGGLAQLKRALVGGDLAFEPDQHEQKCGARNEHEA